MTMRRILLIGGSGVFGERLARHLATIDGLDLILTSRDAAKARTLAGSIPHSAATQVSGIGLDHRHRLAERLVEIAPWLVIDASGPFQGASYAVPGAALEAGAHVIDLADAREYLLGYGTALDDLARSRGLVAWTGASSTPALSAAAVAALTKDWKRIDSITIAIAPGGRSEVGKAVIAAILTYAGRPVPIWREGELQEVTGWLDNHILGMPRLGKRRIAAVETVDAQALGAGLNVKSKVSFGAGLESVIEQRGLMMLAWLHRAGLIGRLDRLITFLLAARKLTRIFTSGRGGMVVAVTGLDGNGSLRHTRWSLVAEQDHGPYVPTLATAAAVKMLTELPLQPGARSAGDALTLSSIEAEMAHYAISTQIDTQAHGPSIFEQALGETTFSALPAPLQQFHGSNGHPVWHGRATVENGRNPVAWLIRRIARLPEASEDIPVTVSVDRLASDSDRVEVWTRNFDGARFSSRIGPDRDGGIEERFGLLSFRLGLAAREEGLELPVVAARFCGIPLPRKLLPRADAVERVDREGRFHFDVKLTLPFFGLLVRYSGWLAPRT